VLRDHPAERPDILEGAAHQHRVVHAPAVVGEHPDPCRRVGHGAQLGQLAAAQADRDGANRLHVAAARLAAEPPDLLDHAGGVRDRIGVGHRVHRGEAAERGSRGPRGHGLGILPARFAQVRVQVDKAGQQDQPVGVQPLRTWLGNVGA
jgi:hypothetical protein